MSVLALVGTKFCSRCKRTKAQSEFGINRKERDGLKIYCKPCERQRLRDYYATPRGREIHAAIQKRSHVKNYAKPARRAWAMWGAAKKRARDKGVVFELTREWVQERVERGECEVSGIKFDLSFYEAGLSRIDGAFLSHPYGPSLDRKNPARGYTEENCRVICYVLNAAFGHWGEEVFSEIANAYFQKKQKGFIR